RGARAHAELLGAGAASEPQESALPWSADPTGRAFACAMRGALADAGLEPDAVRAAVLAAGDAVSEAAERAALEAVFGDRAASLPVLTPKRAFGEALAASAGLGLLSALALLEESSVAVVNAFEAGGATASLLVRVLAR
ncbi:MAG: hypothetical protein HY723_04370, partial [Chloroflexi bacterium]|nr:hypothetical protein [Chloroflexota bacterium]